MPSNAITKQAPDALATLRQMLEGKNMLAEITKALPKGWNTAKFVRTVVTAAQFQPKIAECSVRSVAGAVMEAAQLGFELDRTLGHCALVPLKNRTANTLDCNMWPMYRGYISLAMRTGVVTSVFAHVVREGEEFQVAFGTQHQIHHQPKFPQSTEQKTWTGVYAVVIYKDGSRDFEYVDRDRVLAIKKRSPSVRAGMPSPWDTDEEPMWMKTAIRRLMKRQDLSAEDRRLPKLAMLEEYKEAGLARKTGLGIDQYDISPEPAAEPDAPIRISDAEAVEVQGKEVKAPPPATSKKPEAKATPTPKGKPISAKEQSDLFNAAAQQMDTDSVSVFIRKIARKHGFDTVKEITVDKLPAILAEIKAGGYPEQ